MDLGRNLFRDWVDTARETLGTVLLRKARSRAEPHPPLWLRDVGFGDFEKTGEEFLRCFIKIACLQPGETVLDIGCGPGRMALPLSGYLHSGNYVGVDVTVRAIRWCQRNISRRSPQFKFHHANIFNGRYNPRGKIRASEYMFPFGADSFDFVFLTSVFTHMLPDDVRHYLYEIARLLRPKGRMLATFFLLNQTQRELAQQNRNDIDFRHCRGIYRTRDESIPENALAIEEGEVRRMFGEASLEVIEPIHFGGWTGRAETLSYQDIVLAVPKAAKKAEVLR